ncbi:hypothetical protein H0H93_005275 [Arthromyces matolae]|nr:hypothetical protein H0H93_005275 [Arthromyces matolae]
MEHVLRALKNPKEDQMNGFKKWLNMPPEVARQEFFSAANAANWVNVERYGDYMRYLIGQSSQSSAATTQKKREYITVDDSPPSSIKKEVKRAKMEPEVIELSSDSEDEFFKILPADDTKKSLAVVEHRSIQPPPPSQPSAAPSTPTRVAITKKTKVDAIVELDKIPERWPIPDPNTTTAYIISFNEQSGLASTDTTITNKPKGLDALLKSEDQDSWGQGTNGSTTQDSKLVCLDNIPARRSVHLCNGALRCEHFDQELLAGYARVDGEDMSKMQEIFARGQRQNETDAGSVLGVTASFHHMIQAMKCKKNALDAQCVGTAVLKPLSNPPSPDGKKYFVGCSKWERGSKFEHLYAPIPAGVDEDILFQLMNGQPVESPDLQLFEAGCSTFLHPRHGKQKNCKHVHFRSGLFCLGMMKKFPCPVKKIVYTSKDPKVQKVVVIFEGRHTHPPWPKEKPSLDAKRDVAKCLDFLGALGATSMRLDNAPSTFAILGASLSSKHPALRNKKVMSEIVRKQKLEVSPAGTNWRGITDQFEKDQQLPESKRYLWHILMTGNLKLVVTMNPTLAGLVHSAQFLQCDYTFKRVHGEFDELEFVIWHRATTERVTIARLYCNSSTREAFGHLFEGFFSAVHKATGHPIKFKIFDPKGNLLTIIFDMEASQVQGFADALVRLRFNDSQVSKIEETDPEVLIQYILKLCVVHFTRWASLAASTAFSMTYKARATDKLVQSLGQDVVNYLNKFPALETAEDILAFHEFCKSHPSALLKNWYTHKITYKWLLPGFNRSLSRVPKDFWDKSPNNTNLVETAHAHTNRNTQTNLKPLEAIETARKFDEGVATSILTASQECILRNNHNSEVDRMRRGVSRRTHAEERRTTHKAIDDEIKDTRANIASVSKRQKELKEKLKGLGEKKKEAGRSPRHSSAPGSAFDNIVIPRIRGLQIDQAERSEPDLLEASDKASHNELFGIKCKLVSTAHPLILNSNNEDTNTDYSHSELATPPFLVASNAPSQAFSADTQAEPSNSGADQGETVAPVYSDAPFDPYDPNPHFNFDVNGLGSLDLSGVNWQEVQEVTEWVIQQDWLGSRALGS